MALPFFMNVLPIAAGIGIEGIIWVIILIFWSIAQYVQKSRAAQRRPPIPGRPPLPQAPRPPPTKMETDLQELLRELTGQPTADQDEEEEEPIQPAPPPIRRTPPLPSTMRQPQTLASTRRAIQPPPPPAPVRWTEPVRIQSVAPDDDGPDVGEIAEGMGEAFANAGKMPGMTLKMRSVSLRGISYSGSSGYSGSGLKSFSLSDLRDKATLRRMVIGRMVLDKPKALDPASGM